MSAILLLSIFLRSVAMVSAALLVRRVHDLRMLFPAGVLAVMIVEQLVLLSRTSTGFTLSPQLQWHHLPDLLVSILAVISVFALERMIRQRRRVVRKLEKSASVLRQIMDLVPVPIFAKDREGRFLLANKAVAEAYGTDPDTMIGKRQQDLYEGGENLDAFLAEDLEVIETGEPKHIGEETFVRPDGSRRIFSTTKIPFSIDEDSPPAALGVSIDITEQKRTQESLRKAQDHLEEQVHERTVALMESEERFRQMAESIDEVFFLVERSSSVPRILYTSPGYEKVWGRSREELYSNARAWMAAIHPEDRQAVAESYENYETEPEFTNEFRITRPDGEQRWILSRGSTVRNPDTNTVRIAGVSLDITEQKRIQEELSESNEELEAFVQSISHDLKAPLRAIEGFAQALVDDYSEKLDDNAREYLALMKDGVDRMEELLNDLLQHARLGRDVSLDPVDMNEVVQRVVATLAPAIAEKHAQVRVDGELPAVVGHRATLETAMQNLISNAIKFVRPGDRPEIVIGAREERSRHRFYVRDNGIGIDPKYHEGIFSMFERLHPRKTYPGTGIGLAIVKKAAALHTGQVTVESRPGGGSTFWFSIPHNPSQKARPA